MRKVFGYIVLVVCIVIYIFSSVPSVITAINYYKVSPKALITSDRKYGDLYQMCNLSYFRMNKQQKVVTQNNSGEHNIDLYAVCDSYIWSFTTSPEYYHGVNKLTFIKTNDREELKTKLDTSKVNVLLLEFTERNFIKLLTDDSYYKTMVSVNKNDDIAAYPKKASLKKTILGSLSGIAAVVFNSKINTNLESIIWDNQFTRPLKEFKADLNMQLFNTINKDVLLSSNGKQLFYNDTAKAISAFKPLSNGKLDTMINRLNWIYNNSKKSGFDKVYLTVVPNPISVIEPNYHNMVYNRLVERLQNSPKLLVPSINLWPQFNKEKSNFYYASDTHWNWDGANMWLNKFNTELMAANKKLK